MWAAIAASCVAIWFGLDGLSGTGRIALIIFLLTTSAWIASPFDETAVALAGAVALLVSGCATTEALNSALGNELVWLIIAAFMIGAVLRETGITTRLANWAISGANTVRMLFHSVTFLIILTIFLIPATSARAALLLPVFLGLADSLGRPRLTRALSLLFPSVILLSACGVLTGAGAHLIAVDYLKKATGGQAIGYGQWAMLNLPIAVVTSHLAAELILRLFLTPAERRLSITPQPAAPALSNSWPAYYAAVIAALTVALWVTSEWHGLGLATIGLASALLLTLPGTTGVSLKDAIRKVEWPMILFFAATMLLGDTLMTSGVGAWVAGHLVSIIPGFVFSTPILMAAFVTTVALLAHIVISSRSARAAVLVPVFALPLAAAGPGLGYSPVSLVLLTATATGFCQTFPASAKSVALYSGLDVETYSAADLLKLAAALLPFLIVIFTFFAAVVWPSLGVALIK